jgi:ribosomal protein S18 acetylase RimI-like enzyme
MLELRSVEKTQVFDAFMEAFADYAMDATGTTEERMTLRMQKNAVDYDLSPGVYDGDRLVGFTLIGIDAWGGCLTAYDAGTGIVPDFRKQGWARKMFDHALPTLRDRGVDRFVLEVLQQNEPAIKAYRKSGFETVRELRCLIADVETLRALSDESNVRIEPIDARRFHTLTNAADWVPSFENRFSVVDAIPDHVTILGAWRGEECIGAIAYSPPLNWLLSLLVRRDARRQGIGRALVRHLAHHVPEAATRLTAINIDGADVGMQRFFTGLGFEPLVDQYEMVLDL